MHLHWIDLLIVLVYVSGTIAAGILARSSIKGISDFRVAGRSLKTHMAVATMVSTGLGLVTVMYFSQEGFVNGFSPFLIGVIARDVRERNDRDCPGGRIGLGGRPDNARGRSRLHPRPGLHPGPQRATGGRIDHQCRNRNSLEA